MREGREPELVDLKESGSIEEDSDKIVMLSGSKDLNGNRLVNMYIRKNRQGKGGDIKIVLKPNDTFSDFRELTEEEQAMQAI